MKYSVQTKKGRTITCKKEEKKCFICKTKKGELFLNEATNKLTCVDCMCYFNVGPSIESENIKIDTWEFVK